MFVDVASKAMQRKALRESLAPCSAALKKHVAERKILKRKHPLGALDLCRLVKAARLSYSDQNAMAVVTVGGSPSAP